MPNRSRRRGWGFGFRGSSPPWPFVGIGSGGLPRCGYFLSEAAAPTPGYPYPGFMPYVGMPAGAHPHGPSMSREQELDFLRNQAQNIRSQLEQIDARIKELEAEE